MEKRAVKYHRGRLGEAFREEIETLVEGELALQARPATSTVAAVPLRRPWWRRLVG